MKGGAGLCRMVADVLENLLMWQEKLEGTEWFDCTCYPMGMTGTL